MNRKPKKILFLGISLICLFILWTALLTLLDRAPIGPNGSSVGFAKLNGYFHELTGVNMTLYTITDWLGIIPVLFALGFAILGLFQLVKRKSLLKVDRTLLLLGGFYLAVITVFIVFEKIVINYRPVLIEGVLEVSYPSSTTLLFSTVIPTAISELDSRIKHRHARLIVSFSIGAMAIFGVVGRVLSGAHWITDIIGGILVSSGLVLIYLASKSYFIKSEKKVDTGKSIC